MDDRGSQGVSKPIRSSIFVFSPICLAEKNWAAKWLATFSFFTLRSLNPCCRPRRRVMPTGMTNWEFRRANVSTRSFTPHFSFPHPCFLTHPTCPAPAALRRDGAGPVAVGRGDSGTSGRDGCLVCAYRGELLSLRKRRTLPMLINADPKVF